MSKLETHYQRIFDKEENDFRLRALFDLIIKLLPRKGKILDLGCGSGLFSCALSKMGYQVIAADPSLKMIAMTRKRKKLERAEDNLKIIQASAFEIEKIDDKFDAVLMLDVLEHINNDKKALMNLKEVIKPNGLLIISVPAHPYLLGKRDKSLGHHRRYSKKMAEDLIKDSGYNVSQIRYWNFPGYFAYLFSEKILKKPINENIRYRTDNWARITKRVIYKILKLESRIKTPIGLSIIAVAHNE